MKDLLHVTRHWLLTSPTRPSVRILDRYELPISLCWNTESDRSSFLWIMHSLTSAIQHLTCHLLPGCLSFWFLELYNSGGTHACIVVGLAHRFYVTYSLTYVVVKC